MWDSAKQLDAWGQTHDIGCAGAIWIFRGDLDVQMRSGNRIDRENEEINDITEYDAEPRAMRLKAFS